MNIKILELTPERLPESAELLTNVFHSLEPLTAALHLPRDCYANYVRAVCEYCLDDRFAVIALDQETDRVAGVALGLDDGKYQQTRHVIPAEYRAAMDQIDDFFERLDQPLALIEGQLTFVFYLAVAPDYWRAGISIAMLTRLEEILRDKNYEYIATEATNPKSAGAFRKQGYTEIYRLAYASYAGPFAALPGDCTLLLKKLA